MTIRHPRSASTLVLLGSLASGALASPTGAQSLELPKGTYRAAESFAQLKDCHFRALSEGLRLDSLQEAGFRQAIEVFRDTSGAVPKTPRAWRPRTLVRDSTMLSLLRSPADSARFRRNSRGEQLWFEAGNCNGK